jgi:hypothetical protein
VCVCVSVCVREQESLSMCERAAQYQEPNVHAVVARCAAGWVAMKTRPKHGRTCQQVAKCTRGSGTHSSCVLLPVDLAPCYVEVVVRGVAIVELVVPNYGYPRARLSRASESVRVSESECVSKYVHLFVQVCTQRIPQGLAGTRSSMRRRDGYPPSPGCMRGLPCARQCRWRRSHSLQGG